MACAMRMVSSSASAPSTFCKLRVVSTSASAEKGEDDTSDNVLTENRDETWNSGKTGYGFIDLDLGAPCAVEHLDLLPYQVPTPAFTCHRIWAGNSMEALQLVQEVKRETKHHEWVQGVALGGREARFIRVETVDHPGWVAWSGINVFGQKK